MSEEKVDYSKADDVSKDGLRLFKIMMRLEFALKDQGYIKGNTGSAAEVAWDKYAKEKLGKPFFDKIKKTGRAEVLISKPPKRQTVNADSTLCWKQANQAQNITDLIMYLRRVRNNLFHGGKSGDPDSDRNAELFENSLFVIDEVLKFDFDLKTSFTGQY